MSRLDAKRPSLCTSEPLTKEAISCVLSVFSEIVKSCYGPTGRFKQLHNGMGGYVRTTSQSSALLAGLCVTHPVLKLLTASVQSHLSRFSDCGLFTAILCCSLLEKIRALNVAPCTSIKICQHLLSLCTDYLSSEACGCRVPVDFGSSKIPLGLVRSVLTSKRACMLSRNEVDHISTLVLKAFVLTISPQNTETSVAFGKCLYIPVKDRRAMDSAVYPGLLIETPDLDLTTELPVRTAPSCAIKMALFSLSLSGDLSDTGEGTIFVHRRVFLQAEVLGQLLNLGRQMVDDGVSLVVCQKVIHPALKQYLKEKHVVAVERVGAALMEPLKQITGSQPMPSLQFLSPACYGHLKDLRAESFASKRFLHLIPDDPVVCSLVLCSRNETAWEELRLACQTAEHVLQLTVSDPWVLLGGGCTETHLSSYVRHKSCAVTCSTLENLCCSRAEFQLVADSFCGSLESVSRCLEHDGGDVLTDTKWGHFWSVPPDLPSGSDWSDVVQRCGCGLCGPQQGLDWKILQCRSRPFPPQSCVGKSSVTSADNPVLDCFAAKRNGLQVAVETASLLLDLSYIVEDRN
ncbi:molecular chaperone MKKS-like isoform X1 [Podarcis raffonei]|uniref:molecular chaperone MKKS-like isoform X1 n=1 Tax=Podarcis raffonei TaxID=65483 RepID=UPI0023297EBF|nr:molecular chaperone MKKS-like isoform X1 [Podarcis raffonei]